MLHSSPISCGLQKFFEITPFGTTISSACSPASFFSRAFPCSNWRNHCVRDVHFTDLAAPFVKGRIRNVILTAQIDNANASLGLPQDPNNLLFSESTTFYSCAPMLGTLTFQWHTFRGKGQMPHRTWLFCLPASNADESGNTSSFFEEIP